MDKLEEFIRKNRGELDRYNSPSGAWRNIRKALKGDKTPVIRWISIAAMTIVILGSATVLYKFIGWKSESATGLSIYDNNNLTKPHLEETEIYYNNLVNSLYREASPLLTSNPEIGEELTNDMSQLDSICLDIKRDLKDNVSNQEVVEALIQNYRIKIQLLEDMLIILKENEDNQEKPIQHEL